MGELVPGGCFNWMHVVAHAITPTVVSSCVSVAAEMVRSFRKEVVRLAHAARMTSFVVSEPQREVSFMGRMH